MTEPNDDRSDPLEDYPMSVVRNVPVAAAIARATNPHIPPPRYCKVCGAKPGCTEPAEITSAS